MKKTIIGKKNRLAPLADDVRDAFLKEAAAHHGNGRFDLAGPLYEHVEKHNPDALAATFFRGLMDMEVGRLEAAAKRLGRVVAGEPNSYDAVYALAFINQEMGRWPEAERHYRRAAELKPDLSQPRYRLAHVLEVMGRMDDAVALLRMLGGDKQERPRVLSAIARIRPEEISAADMAELQGAAEDGELAGAPRAGLYFSLGQLLERARRYDEAFAAFAKGNRLRRTHLDESGEEPPKPGFAPPSARSRALQPEIAARQHKEDIVQAKKIFTPEFFAAHEGQGHDSAAPIFIVGMPRSGSTLLEQILSSHAKVTGLGEAPALWNTIAGQYPLAPGSASRNHFRQLGDAYLERLKALGWRGTPFVADKMLGNYLSIGMIHLMFPKARIIHSVRDAVDTCLGCYRQTFRTGNEMTYDLKDIGEQYVRYREMMDHWSQVLPGRVTDVVHEDLILAPETKIRWFVEQACRLKWDPACLDFHKTDKPVRTASIAQVRQPISTTAIERWRHYEQHLGPLFEALGPYAPRRELT